MIRCLMIIKQKILFDCLMKDATLALQSGLFQLFTERESDSPDQELQNIEAWLAALARKRFAVYTPTMESEDGIHPDYWSTLCDRLVDVMWLLSLQFQECQQEEHLERLHEFAQQLVVTSTSTLDFSLLVLYILIFK